MNRLHPPAAVLEIAERLEAAGYEAWCVGGAVRDALLGHDHLDWDFATSATPEQVRATFGARRTIPVGIEFGTVGVLDRENAMHEVTTFRRDVKTDGRHAEVAFGVSLEDDLARRDFTINAIAYSPKLGEVRDPFGGQEDLERRIIRAVGDPEARMREDRLRALRAIRFAARFNFAIDDATRRAIANSAPHLGRLSPERVKQELDKTMEQVRAPSAAFENWKSSGAFATLIPALDAVSQSALRVPDCLAMPGLPKRPARRVLRFAGLLCSLTVKSAVDVLMALRASKAEVQTTASLVERWHWLGAAMADALTGDRPVMDGDVRRWVATIGRLHVGAFLRLASAVWAVQRTDGADAPTPQAVRTLYKRMSRIALRDPIDLGSLAADGDDLRRAGIPPGPALGKILQALLEAVIDDPSRNTTDWLLQEGRRMYEAGLQSKQDGDGRG